VDRTNDISVFLTSRRAKVTPEQAGLPSYGKRRVAGLRREEVASLAGVSVEYYKRLERGNLSGVSDMVLEALARALQLDDAERAHLFDLARAAGPAMPTRRRAAEQQVRPSVERLFDALNAPAYVRNNRRDILAANALGQALYSEMYLDPVRPVNVVRFVFLNPRAQDVFLDWDGVANNAVASLRIEAGRNPFDRGLSDLVGELSTRSEDFRTRWAAHNVRFHQAGAKRLRHAIVGELDLTFEAMDLTADPGLTVVTYSAEAGSRSEEGLNLLASWSATLHHDETARAADEARRAS
jgi:transcriptional regulator with XRE-family HTH domain